MDELTKLVSKIRSTWVKATCRCDIDKLRFVRKIHGDEINIVNDKRYEYQCAVCGKMVYKERPITCEGCRYIASDKFGSILCSREYEDFCLLVNRKYWTERKKRVEMNINKKMDIVIKNYFEKECTVDTSIREAFAKGFEIGLKKGAGLKEETVEQLSWNPVSKSLPPEEMMVEITICEDNGDTTLKYTDAGWYYKGFWVVNNEIRYDVTAWKSFSKAYEGE